MYICQQFVLSIGSMVRVFSAETATEDNVLNCGAALRKSKLVIIFYLFVKIMRMITLFLVIRQGLDCTIRCSSRQYIKIV